MLLASAFDINGGIALRPAMLLFVNFLVALFPVLAIISDAVDPTAMRRPPRDPAARIFNATTGPRWLVVGVILALTALVPLVWGPDAPRTDGPSISMTMTFGVAAFATLGLGLVMRRDPAAAWQGPYHPYLTWLAVGALLTWCSVELSLLQRWLGTESLSGWQWLGVLGLALVTPLAVEADKAFRRRRGRGALGPEDRPGTP